MSADGALRPAVPPGLDDLAHDLRAAHAEVMAGLRLIDPSGLDPASLAQHLRVRAASESMSRLIKRWGEEIVAARQSSVGAGAGAPGPSPSAEPGLAALLEDYRSRGTAAAQALGRSFLLVAQADLPPDPGVDATILDRIAANLVDNSLRHCASGPVTMGVMVQGDRLRICVTDEGPGFPPAILSGEGQVGAGGLGIVRALVGAAGGSMRLSNRLGGGAEVVILLPIRPAGDGAARTMTRGYETPGDDTEPAGVGELLDLHRLDQLLDMAGEATANQLLERLSADLANVEIKLAEALLRRDVAAMRYQSHVLTSLAGTVGARELLDLAEQMNALAHGETEGSGEECMRRISTLIARLTAYLGRLRQARSGGA